MVNNNYIIVNNNFSEYIINLCRFGFFWDTLYNKSFHAYFNRVFYAGMYVCLPIRNILMNILLSSVEYSWFNYILNLQCVTKFRRHIECIIWWRRNSRNSLHTLSPITRSRKPFVFQLHSTRVNLQTGNTPLPWRVSKNLHTSYLKELDNMISLFEKDY